MEINEQRVTTELLRWYEKNKRSLPWRQRREPYDIWISEIMLQQTKVETVIKYYNRFMNHFSTINELAQAELDDVLKLWEGLGYYSRAKNIYKTAKIIVEQYGGVFPESYEDILGLPGIGPYTAGAISSIAFNRSYPAVDGNVLRVISRIYMIEKDIAQRKTKKEIEDIVRSIIPEGDASNFNQSLMELGAMICIPSTPICLVCPVMNYCQAFHEKKQNSLPIKTKKAKQKVVHRHIAIIRREKYILMNKREETGLLGGLWEFPGVDARTKSEFINRFYKQYKIKIRPSEYVMDAEHIFTHRHWKMKVYECVLVDERNIDEKKMQWISKENLGDITIPTAFKKILSKVL